MKIPDDPARKALFVKWCIDTCTASQEERRNLYAKRRRFYQYGQNQEQICRLNRLKSHLGLVLSFIISADGLSYSITAPHNADEDTIKKYLAIQDDWNNEVRDSGLAKLAVEAVKWGLNYDSMILKQGWNDRTDRLFGELIEPSSFGVFHEDQMDFTSQRAMVHSFLLDWDEAVERLDRAGKHSEIDRIATAEGEADNALPPAVQRMIISATGGANLAGDMVGKINPDYEETPLYKAKIDQTRVRFHEAWIWDDAACDNEGTRCGDFRMIHMLEPDIIVSDSAETIAALTKKASNGHKPKWASTTNLYLPQENPFTVFRPYDMYNYFWGDCHLEDLVPLQKWMLERLEQIDEILQKQADPPNSFTGMMSADEGKMEAWGGPGTWVSDQMPGAKAEPHPPEMPEDLFAEFNQIGALFLEQSGMTENIAGRGEKNVRSASHSKQLSVTGGGRIRQVAVGLEEPLARMGEIGLRLKAKNDDSPLRTDNAEFVMAQVLDEHAFKISVSGHSHSPLFTAETHEIAAMLLKAQAIDQEGFIRAINPPGASQMIHSLHVRQKAIAAQREQERAAGIPPAKPNGKQRTSA